MLGRLRPTRTPWRPRWPCLPVGLLTLGDSAAGASSPTITVYSGQHEQTTQSLITAFEKKTGINVAVRYDDEDTFADEIQAEKSHPVADVFYTENSPPLQYLQQKGMLAKLNASTLAKTPSTYNSANGDWVGVSARVSVLIYNPSLISESQLPTTVWDWPTPNTKASWLWPRARRTSNRSSPRSTRPTARPPPFVAERHQVQRR